MERDQKTSQTSQLTYNNDHNLDVVGREQEYEELLLSLKQFFVLDHFGCLMIHGDPGIGKTCLIKKLQNDYQFQKQNDIYRIVFVNVNNYSQNDKLTIIKAMGTQLDISVRSMNDIVKRINNLNEKEKKVIVVLDEIDMVMEKKFTHITSWLCQCLNGLDNCNNCVVIGLSNETTNTYELIRTFEACPYFNHIPFTQLPIEDIYNLITKIDNRNLLDKEAIDFVVEKVLNKGGDIREAYELINRSILCAQEQGVSKVNKFIAVTAHKMNSPEESFRRYLNGLNDDQLCLAISLHITPESEGYVVLEKWFDCYQKCRNCITQRNTIIRKQDFYSAVENFISQGLLQKVVEKKKRNTKKVSKMDKQFEGYLNGSISVVVKRYNSVIMDGFLRGNQHAKVIFNKIDQILSPSSIQGLMNSKRNVTSYL